MEGQIVLRFKFGGHSGDGNGKVFAGAQPAGIRIDGFEPTSSDVIGLLRHFADFMEMKHGRSDG